MNDKTTILGVNVSALNYTTCLTKIYQWLEKKEPKSIFVSAVHLIMECQDDPTLKEAVNKADFVTPDGMPLVWLSQLSGKKSVKRVYGPDLTKKLLTLAALKQYSVFLLGGAPGQGEKLKRVITKKLPTISIVGYAETPIRPIPSQQNKEIVRTINEANADILFVGLGCPYQEKWIAQNRKKINSTIAIGVGAAFNFITGDVKQAPPLLQKMGLEWLFRLTQEPKRLWKRYTLTNARFLFKLAIASLPKLNQN